MAISLAEFAAYLMYFATVGLVGYFFDFGVSTDHEVRRRRRNRTDRRG